MVPKGHSTSAEHPRSSNVKAPDAATLSTTNITIRHVIISAAFSRMNRGTGSFTQKWMGSVLRWGA